MSEEYDKVSQKFDSALEEFNSLTATLEEDLLTENTQLKDALNSQIPLEYKWFPVMSNVRALRTFADSKKDDSYYSELDASLNNSYRKRSITEARELAKASDSYRKWLFIYNEIDDLYSDIKDIVDIIHNRRYVLNNTTNAFVSSAQNNII